MWIYRYKPLMPGMSGFLYEKREEFFVTTKVSTGFTKGIEQMIKQAVSGLAIQTDAYKEKSLLDSHYWFSSGFFSVEPLSVFFFFFFPNFSHKDLKSNSYCSLK